MQTGIGLRLTGLKPADIRAGDLAQLLISFEDMIAATVRRSHPQISKEELGIGLVCIENKSVGLEFATRLPELTFPAYDTITKAIDAEQFLSLSSETLDALRTIHAFIKGKNCDGELFVFNGQVNLRALLLPKTRIPEHPKVTTRLLLYGRIKRVGGAHPHVMIEPASGKTLFCTVKDEALARQLGVRLYTWVGLEGEAEIDSDSLQILKFMVDGLVGYEEAVSFKDAMAELSVVAGQYYSDIDDVEQYIANLRGEGPR
jgi:hypothetical protein